MAYIPKPSAALGANLLCSASMLIWAAGLPAADHLIPLTTAEQLTALRMGLTALALLPLWLLIEGRSAFAIGAGAWARGLAVGSLITLGAWFLVLGQTMGGAVMAALISASMPLVGMAIEVMFDGRKMTRALILGLGLSLAGGVMSLDWGAGDGARASSAPLGAALCLISVLCFTIGSRLTVTALPQLSDLGRVAVTLSGGALVAAVITLGQGALALRPPLELGGWGQAEWGALALYAWGGMALSQVLWIMSVRRLGIGMAALHINAAPFYVMMILFAMGGAWVWAQAIAAMLVALGVLIAQGIIFQPKDAQP